MVVGDGSFVFTLEKRCYVKAGSYTPEAAVENPEAGNSGCHDFLDNSVNYYLTIFLMYTHPCTNLWLPTTYPGQL